VVVSLVSLGNMLVVLATAVLFVIWSWQLYANARAVAPDQAPKAGWALGAWAIPLAQLVLPAVHLAKVDRVSRGEGRGARPLIIGWMVLFAAATLIYRVVWGTPIFVVWGIMHRAMFGTRGSLQRILDGDRRDIWVQLLFAAAAVLAISMVRAMTQRQEQLLVLRHRDHLAYLAAREARLQQGPPAGYSAPVDRRTEWSVPPPHPNAPPAPGTSPPG
jgi:hypothetical protein